MKTIDTETWPRQETFEFFKTFENPLFNVCVQPEITKLDDFLETHGKIGSGQLFGAADDQPADQCTRQAAETADDGCRKGFNA